MRTREVLQHFIPGRGGHFLSGPRFEGFWGPLPVWTRVDAGRRSFQFLGRGRPGPPWPERPPGPLDREIRTARSRFCFSVFVSFPYFETQSFILPVLLWLVGVRLEADVMQSSAHTPQSSPCTTAPPAGLKRTFNAETRAPWHWPL